MSSPDFPGVAWTLQDRMDEGDFELFAVEYQGQTHIFDDPGARKLWIDEEIEKGAKREDFESWEE
ncbi:hypothetical protein [Nocardia jiangxiensis]|uniref:hypothetical protein n=1 Tax=Nocardia jiangxiensis TaxID=282685 RepID=UPI0005945696|nr:hypothetical protein [Nocardia jiangxiensis]